MNQPTQQEIDQFNQARLKMLYKGLIPKDQMHRAYQEWYNDQQAELERVSG